MAIRTLKSDLPVAEAFKAEYLEYYRMLPLTLSDGVLAVAVSGEPNRDALADLEQSYDARLELIPTPIEELLDAIRASFDASESMVELIKDLDGAVGAPVSLDEPLTDLRDLANQPPVIRYVNLLIRDAHEARASDIHLEATREGLRVRLRIDGVLSELPSPPRSIQAAIVSRV
jgi:type II secretory ATPase GspE/PulE/Tfp pilus assembly ATPase PilB-like protein